MTQATYPLQAYVYGVWQDDGQIDDDKPLEAVYILEGEQVYDRPYGVKRAWNEAQQ